MSEGGEHMFAVACGQNPASNSTERIKGASPQLHDSSGGLIAEHHSMCANKDCLCQAAAGFARFEHGRNLFELPARKISISISNR